MLSRLHELMPMTELHRMKEAIALRGLVPCPSLETIYRQLNGVKGRLLGDGAEAFEVPLGAAGAPAAAAASVASRKGAQRAAGMAPGATAHHGHQPHAPVRYRLKVSVMGLRGLKEGAAKVYVHVRCHGHGHKSAPAFRSGRTASFAESVQYQFDDLDEQQLLGLQVFEDAGGGQVPLPMGGAEVPMARLGLGANPSPSPSPSLTLTLPLTRCRWRGCRGAMRWCTASATSTGIRANPNPNPSPSPNPYPSPSPNPYPDPSPSPSPNPNPNLLSSWAKP